MIPSSFHNDDLYSGKLNTWNVAHTLNQSHDFASFGSSSIFPSPSAPRSCRKWQYPTGQRSIRRMPADRPTGRGRASTRFPQRYEGMTHVWRIVRERQRERSDSDSLSQSVGLINAQRIYNICGSREQRILGNRGCAEVESQITETL